MDPSTKDEIMKEMNEIAIEANYEGDKWNWFIQIIFI